MVFDDKRRRGDSNKRTQAFTGVDEVRRAERRLQQSQHDQNPEQRVARRTPTRPEQQVNKARAERDEAYRQYMELRRSAKQEPEKEPIKRKRVKKKKKRPIKRAIIVILLLLIVAVAGVILFALSTLDKVGRIQLDESKLGINPAVEQNLKDYQNIALLGIDSRDMSDFEHSRTDAIIVVSLDKKSKEVRQFSIFRDTYLHVDEKNGYDKITNVHAYNSTEGTLHTLNQNMDLNIKEVAIVNWKSVADLIDGMGGIEVDIKESEIKEMNKYIKDTQKNIGGSKEKINAPGMQNLNGNQAVTYARIRKDSVKGDYRRNERMKIVLSAAMDKAKTLSPFELNDLANKVLPEIKTNMSSNDMLKTLWAFVRYDSGKSDGWPFDVASLNRYGVWYGPPDTLKSNVSELYERYFNMSDYTPTQTVLDYSKEISNRVAYQ